MNTTAEIVFLNSQGISVTPIRLLVLQQFFKHQQAFSLKDLEEKLIFSERSTIFRTLHTFEKKGILHELIAFDGLKRYALCADCKNEAHNDQHTHLNCRKCESVFCIPVNTNNFFSLKEAYHIDDVQVFVNGICEACNTVA